MLFSTVIMAAVALVFMVVAHLKGEGMLLKGLGEGSKLLVQTLPLLFFAFLVAGLIQTLIPRGTFPWGTLCCLPHCCRLISGRRQYRYSGGICYCLVTLGGEQNAS